MCRRTFQLECLRSGDYTTDSSDAPLSRSKPVASTFAFPERKCRFCLIYPTKLLLIQHRIVSCHSLPALGSTRRSCDTQTPDPPSPLRLSARSPVHQRDLRSPCHKDADGILGNHRLGDRLCVGSQPPCGTG